MSTFRSQADSTSRRPEDWGRAVAIALHDLVAQSQAATDNLQTAELFGADLVLHIDPKADGATITLTWDNAANASATPKNLPTQKEPTA